MRKVINDGQEFIDTMEALVDRSSLNYVLNTLTQICFLKADHISSNWQDEGLAKLWIRAGEKIEALADTKNFEGL